MEDKVLIARWLAGDPDAVATVRSWIRVAFRSYQPRLTAEREDLEQEILLEAMRSLQQGRFDGRSRLRTYLNTYVHHKCIDRLRSLGRREWVPLEELDLPSAAPTPLARLSAKENVEMALRILAEMPESCRELWQLLQQGLGYREMSRRREVSEVTLRSRVLRCRRRAKKIRARLQKSVQRIPSSSD